MDIYIELLSINFNLLSALWLPSDQWFWNLYCSNNNMIAKYIALSNIISVVSDNILRICIQESLLISKKVIDLFHTLPTYNSLLVRYNVYSSDPRECLRTSWRYAETYEDFSIDPAPCWKNPKKKKLSYQIVSPRRNLHWNKNVTAKVCLVWSLLLRKLTLKQKRDS